jgi:hypothetical protein
MCAVFTALTQRSNLGLTSLPEPERNGWPEAQLSPFREEAACAVLPSAVALTVRPSASLREL